MVLAMVRMAIHPQKRDEALKILKLTAEQCRIKPSCLDCHVYEDLLERDVLMFEQRWKSEEDLERHLRSDDYRRVLLVMEMAHRQPEISFDTISGSTGIETVVKVRSQANSRGKS